MNWSISNLYGIAQSHKYELIHHDPSKVDRVDCWHFVSLNQRVVCLVMRIIKLVLMLKYIIAMFEGKAGVGIGVNNGNGHLYLTRVYKTLNLVNFDGTNGISLGLNVDFLAMGFMWLDWLQGWEHDGHLKHYNICIHKSFQADKMFPIIRMAPCVMGHAFGSKGVFDYFYHIEVCNQLSNDIFWRWSWSHYFETQL